jgi:hypothetical protein
MSRIRQHVQGSRLATAGITATATLLAGLFAPAADAADRPTRTAALDNAAAVLADRAAALGLTSAQDVMEVQEIKGRLSAARRHGLNHSPGQAPGHVGL